MRVSTRLAALALVAGAVATAPASPAAAHTAIPDPAALVECVSTTATDLTGLVDPASLALPGEIPGTACLAP
ncbi:hypothetical protein Misp01_79830 [Microtetraspora sp. NBRC 13810]|uniref:hypothetical protein n=1 Tax=Microtetraspora sp. NBRC 13810 TaxID=3030990 RepID=UPI0024A16627|nr:hypothetical protein [Microtetraspora sp. NBRC 13810]GLW12855.1 hypothetical protein Misp01_79830 [Microtetraspora sp. NBRC 13810]